MVVLPVEFLDFAKAIQVRATMEKVNLALRIRGRKPLYCPYCQFSLAGTLPAVLQWGYCTSGLPQHDYEYLVGDAIKWQRCKDGSVPAWTLFWNAGYNAGDPQYTNLVNPYSWHSAPCYNCNQPLGGSAVEVRNGTITAVWVYKLGNFPSEYSYHLINADGSLTVMMEWEYKATDHVVYDNE